MNRNIIINKGCLCIIRFLNRCIVQNKLCLFIQHIHVVFEDFGADDVVQWLKERGVFIWLQVYYLHENKFVIIHIYINSHLITVQGLHYQSKGGGLLQIVNAAESLRPETSLVHENQLTFDAALQSIWR